MPTFGMILIYFVGRVPGFNSYSIGADKNIALIAISIIFFSTSIIPLFSAIILKKLNIISSLQMQNREERTIPFIITCFCYFGVYYLLRYHLELNLSRYFFSFFCSSSCNCLSATLCFHSGSKPMSSFPNNSTWLICSFHEIFLFLLKFFDSYR